MIPTINAGFSNPFALIGVLPGFNNIIDTQQYDFEKELLHNITFIDLIPVTYSVTFIDEILKKLQNQEYQMNTETLYEYRANDQTVLGLFQQIVSRYLGTSNIGGLRIIASSDSTFTESFSINFEENDLLSVNTLSQTKFGSALNAARQFNSVISGINRYSPAKGLEFYKEFSQTVYTSNSAANFLSSLFKAQIFGVNFALPEIFTSTSYTPTYSVFLKLTSPTGHIEDVTNYIINPLVLLLIAASPISFDAKTYGFPFLWQVKGYGNTMFNVGAIESLIITRGSMETMYSDDLLPLSVDIRMTIRSLAPHFASIAPLANVNIEVSDELKFVGLYTPYQEQLVMSGNDKIVQTIQL